MNHVGAGCYLIDVPVVVEFGNEGRETRVMFKHTSSASVSFAADLSVYALLVLELGKLGFAYNVAAPHADPIPLLIIY